MIEIIPNDNYSIDVPQIGIVDGEQAIQVLELLAENYPGQTRLARYNKMGFRTDDRIYNKAIELAGFIGFEATKAFSKDEVIF